MDFNGHDFARRNRKLDLLKHMTRIAQIISKEKLSSRAEHRFSNRHAHPCCAYPSTIKLDTLNRSLVITGDISQTTPLTSSEPTSRAGGQLASEICAWQYFQNRSRGPTAGRLETDRTQAGGWQGTTVDAAKGPTQFSKADKLELFSREYELCRSQLDLPTP